MLPNAGANVLAAIDAGIIPCPPPIASARRVAFALSERARKTYGAKEAAVGDVAQAMTALVTDLVDAARNNKSDWPTGSGVLQREQTVAVLEKTMNALQAAARQAESDVTRAIGTNAEVLIASLDQSLQKLIAEAREHIALIPAAMTSDEVMRLGDDEIRLAYLGLDRCVDTLEAVEAARYDLNDFGQRPEGDVDGEFFLVRDRAMSDDDDGWRFLRKRERSWDVTIKSGRLRWLLATFEEFWVPTAEQQDDRYDQWERDRKLGKLREVPA